MKEKLIMEIPHYEHKYITLFNNEESYWNKETSFEEVNYSAIKTELTDNSKRNYQPSIRTTNKDNEYIMNYWKSDVMRGKFFLEIIWGYFGWEWIDYELNGQILTGGNFYKIKEIKTVESIIDGYRLQHINDFLNSQDKVTTVEPFDVSNIVAMNRAFKRLSFKVEHPEMILKINTFPNVIEADSCFYNQKFKTFNLEPVNFPIIENVNSIFEFGFLNENVKFKMENLKSLTNALSKCFIQSHDINISDIFVGGTLNNVSDLSYLLYNAYFLDENKESEYHVTLDISNNINESVNLAYAFCLKKNNYLYKGLRNININIINNDKKINLNSAFNKVCGDFFISIDNNIYITGFKNINVNISNIENVTDLRYAFADNVFTENPPNINGCVAGCADDYIYKNCIFKTGIIYDFSKDNQINKGIGQFNNSYISGAMQFANIDKLENVIFENISFDIPKEFSYIVYNENNNYTGENLPYRDISFKNSQFSGIKSQTIYTNLPYIITGCRFIDFLNEVTINFKNVTNDEFGYGQFRFICDCPEMTKTPIIIGEITLKYAYSEFVKGNTKLKEFRGSLLKIKEGSNYGSAKFTMLFSDSPELEKVELGECVISLDFRNCINLDIQTLSNTLMNQNWKSTINTIELTIQKIIWDRLTVEVQNHCITRYIINIIE